MSEIVTLSMICDFLNPYGKDAKKKYAAMISPTDGHWAPDSDDFEKVVSQSSKKSELVSVKNLGAFLGSLAFLQSGKNINNQRPKQSISRVDLISHGNVTGIALAGTITPAKTDVGQAEVWFDVALPQKIFFLKFFSEGSLQSIEDERKNISVVNSKTGVKVTFDDCLQCFTKNARMVCYACHTAATKSDFHPSILQGMANLFGIEVAGFTSLIKYTYKAGKGISLTLVDDKGVEHGKSSLDYRELDSADVFKVFKPKSKSGNP